MLRGDGSSKEASAVEVTSAVIVYCLCSGGMLLVRACTRSSLRVTPSVGKIGRSWDPNLLC